MMRSLLQIPEGGPTARLHRIPATGIPDHHHDRCHMMMVLSGRGRLRTGDRGDLALEPGVFVFVPPDVPHEFHGLESEMEVFTISLALE